MSLEEKNTFIAIMHEIMDIIKLARDCLVRAPSLIMPSESEPRLVLIVTPARTC